MRRGADRKEKRTSDCDRKMTRPNAFTEHYRKWNSKKTQWENMKLAARGRDYSEREMKKAKAIYRKTDRGQVKKMWKDYIKENIVGEERR